MAVWVLRVSLLDTSPEIWRRVAVPADIPLPELHLVLNASMGWEDYHIHGFEVGEVRYGPPDPDGFEGTGEVDETGYLLSDVLSVGTQFGYLYDFGDDWHHRVEVEREAPDGEYPELPICVEGAGQCPPEDCGGVGGFSAFCAALADPSHEEHRAYREWHGHAFDPAAFSLVRTNRALRVRLMEEQDRWYEEDWPEPLKQVAQVEGLVVVPAAVEQAITNLGGEAIPYLLNLIRVGAPSAATAADMIVAIELPAALEAVREALRSVRSDELTFSDTVGAIAALGPELVEPLLADLAEVGSEESNHRDALLAVLIRGGLHDDQILQQLKVEAERDPATGAVLLGEYGDRRALPFLRSVLDEREFAPGADIDEPGEEIIELAEAIRDLGGTLTAAQEEKLTEIWEYRGVFPLQDDAESGGIAVEQGWPRRRPGRDDPCWCGSGRPYKRCHLRADEAETG